MYQSFQSRCEYNLMCVHRAHTRAHKTSERVFLVDFNNLQYPWVLRVNNVRKDEVIARRRRERIRKITRKERRSNSILLCCIMQELCIPRLFSADETNQGILFVLRAHRNGFCPLLYQRYVQLHADIVLQVCTYVCIYVCVNAPVIVAAPSQYRLPTQLLFQLHKKRTHFTL